MTLFECYDARKGTLRARLAETTTLAQATAALAETLDAVHYDFANDCKDDALRAEAVYMISAVKTTFPLLECASRTKIWESRVSGESGKKRAPKWPAAICLLLGLCLAAGTVMLFYSQNPEFKFGDWQAWLGALGCALILMLIAGMLFMRQPKIVIGDVERTVAVAIDPDDAARRLGAVMLQMDKNLAGFQAEKASEAAEQNGLDASELELASALLEGQYSENGEFALEQLSEVEHWLHIRGVTVRDYSEDCESSFELLPGEREQTLRPALLCDGVLIKKGLATYGEADS